MGFGRTRVGVETGPAIVGDVGIHAKLDYTAHGDARERHRAARSRQQGARLHHLRRTRGGGALRPGAAAAARHDHGARTRGTLAVFEPWPEDAPPAWRERYLAAFRLDRRDRARAIALFEALAAERPDDPVPRRMAERLRAEK